MPSEQKLIATQEQQQQQVLHLTAQQILQVKLLEMPLPQIEQAVKAELCDNPALESDGPEDGYDSAVEQQDYDGDYDSENEGNEDSQTEFAEEQERADREEALDEALNSIGSDDRDERMESDYRERSSNTPADADQEEIVYGESQSFYDNIMQQVSDEDLTPRDREIMNYLVGSLDGDGLLRKDLLDVCDELAIYHGIDCTLADVESVLGVLQGFDPPGIGARNLQECLMLQIARREPSEMRRRMALVVKNLFDEFTKKHWNKIAYHLHLTPEQTERVVNELRRLNPRPGASLGETMGRNSQQVTPDFIIDTSYDGTVSFQLNNGDVPRLHVSPDFEQQLLGYQNNKESLNRMQKEALLYTKEKVERAKGYIEAVQRRRHTMTATMQAIIDIQKKYFRDGDEGELVPMTLKDVADRVGMNVSTISRVCNGKYADTRWGIFPLRHFFSEGYSVNGDSEEMSTRRIKIALREVIDAEDKKKPLSDQLLTEILAKKGFPIARRTVAKYREQLGIPIARLRR